MSTKVKAKNKTNSDKSTLKIKDLKTWCSSAGRLFQGYRIHFQ